MNTDELLEKLSDTRHIAAYVKRSFDTMRDDIITLPIGGACGLPVRLGTRRLSASFLSNACYDGLTTNNAHKRSAPNIIMASNPQRQGSHRGPEAFQALAERRLAKHEPVAKALRSAAPSVVDEIISLAYIQVAKWEDDALCSKDYIAAWRELLKDPVAAAAVLEERSSHAAALRQNSPFVATVRKFQSLAHAA